jgi:hypothetical protein
MSLCQLCKCLDFATISKANSGYGWAHISLFPSNHELYCYEAAKEWPNDESRVLTPYHTSLDSLSKSAAECELCQVVNDSVEKVLDNMRRARELGFAYKISDYKLYMIPLGRAQGFQVIGHSDNEPGTYMLFAGFGLFVDDSMNVPSQ